ncbi:hypothetical protein L6R52_41090 [Myxococcota bacterium]|nr:hypothetical protein [Myxococcota bacterium]
MPVQLSHRGHLVQVGAEKELSMKSLPPNMDRFDETNPARWEPQLAAFTADQLDPAARAKKADQLTWQDLNDAGKAAWITAYRKQYGGDPEILVSPAAPDIDRIDWEHTGELEAVSDVFSDVGKLKGFLDKFGWGHITTSFMRGMPKEERNQMLSFTALANLYVFTHGLEERGADSRAEKGWRFTIKPLAVPTEEHLKVFDGMFDKNRTATAFSKHNQLSIRAGGKYGDPNRIAFEVRGGDVDEKRRLQNAIFASLNESKWGAQPFEWGSNGFRLVKLGLDVTAADPQQVKSLPRDFEALAAQVPGVDAAKAKRIFDLVAGAKFADAPAPARITQFDQRAAIPFLPWKELPFLDDATKARVVAAQQGLANRLDGLAQQGLAPRAAAEQISDALAAWAKEARISEALGRWLDGPPGRPAYL